MDIVERFLKYVSFDTQSAEDAGKTPSTDKQLKLAQYLKQELTELGMTEVELDANGYVYATLPANTDKPLPTIGFIAHMDTSPDCSGANVKPRIVENYDGTDLVLDAEAGIVSTVKKFPELLDHVGEDLIVTDGHTLVPGLVFGHTGYGYPIHLNLFHHLWFRGFRDLRLIRFPKAALCLNHKGNACDKHQEDDSDDCYLLIIRPLLPSVGTVTPGSMGRVHPSGLS